MEHRATRNVAVPLAVLGVAVTLVVMPLVQFDIAVGPVSLDPFMLSALAAFGCAFPLLWQTGRRAFPPSALLAPGLLFCAWCLISVVADGAEAGMFLTFARYLSYLVLALVVGVVARDRGARQAIVWILVGMAVVTAVIAVVQYPTLAAADRELQVAAGMGDAAPRLTRLAATFGNANFYAEYLVLAFAGASFLAATERGTRRVLAVGAAAAVLLTLLFTYTRGSWLALALGALLAVAMVDIRKVWAVVVVGAAGVVAVPGAFSRLQSVLSLGGTAGVRLGLWKVAGAAIAARPLFGIGLGDFYDAFRLAVIANPELNMGVLEFGAHNSFFTLAAETGVLGGLLFVWLVMSTVRGGLYVAGRADLPKTVALGNAALTMGIAAFVINTFTSNTFQHPQGAAIFWVLVGLQIGVGADVWSRAPRPLRKPREARGVLGDSVVVRWSQRLGRALGTAFRASAFGRWAWACPDATAGLVADSRVLGVVLGDGREPGPRERAVAVVFGESAVMGALRAAGHGVGAAWETSALVAVSRGLVTAARTSVVGRLLGMRGDGDA